MIKSKFAKVWLSILILALIFLGARFFNQHAPSLQEVLTQHQTKNPFDLSLFIASMLAFSLAALSIAKGYEIFKRNRTITAALLPEEDFEAEDLVPNKQIELKQNHEWQLQEENAGLLNQLQKLNSRIEEMHKFEEMLRKTNITLGRECERLKAENEELALKSNSLKMKPGRKMTKPRRRKKRKLKK